MGKTHYLPCTSIVLRRHVMVAEPLLLPPQFMVAEPGSAPMNWGRNRLRYFPQLGNWEPALHNRLR